MTNKPTPASQPTPAQIADAITRFNSPSPARSDKDAERVAAACAKVATWPEWKRQPITQCSGDAAERAPSGDTADLVFRMRALSGRSHIDKMTGGILLDAAMMIDALARRATAGTTAAPSSNFRERFADAYKSLSVAASGSPFWNQSMEELLSAVERQIQNVAAERATAGNAAPTEAATENLALVVARLEQIRDSSTEADTREMAMQALVCAQAVASNTATAAPGDLPPLPEPDCHTGDEAFGDAVSSFSGAAMREYGRACIASNAGAAPAIPEHLREFVETVAGPRFSYIDRETDNHACSGCDRAEEYIDSENGCKLVHAPDCIVLRAKTLLAPSINPPVGAAQEKE